MIHTLGSSFWRDGPGEVFTSQSRKHKALEQEFVRHKHGISLRQPYNWYGHKRASSRLNFCTIIWFTSPRVRASPIVEFSESLCNASKQCEHLHTASSMAFLLFTYSENDFHTVSTQNVFKFKLLQLVFLLSPWVILVAAKWTVFSPTCRMVPGATILMHSLCRFHFILYKNFINAYAFPSLVAEDASFLHTPTLIHSFIVTGILPSHPLSTANSRILKSNGTVTNNNQICTVPHRLQSVRILWIIVPDFAQST